MSSYPISVIVPSTRGWPTMRLSLDAVLPQVKAVGGQLIVADASGRMVPPELSGADDVVWLAMPGVAGYELRQAAYKRAEAPIVAVTEDHCRAAADWVAKVMEAHADNPEAAMIFGTVENGTTEHLIDWAIYCVGYLPWAPPLSAGSIGNPGHANVSWKRWAFSRVKPGGDRVMEFRFSAALRARGERVLADNRLRVHHYQCDGIRYTSSLVFHNGRAIAGVRRARMGAADWVRALAPPLVAAYRTLRTLLIAMSKPRVRGVAVRSSPLIAMLHLFHAVGESVGYLSGPGDSATRLH